MPKTKIEWCDLSINPVKGLCPMACSYCYARRMYKRFKWDSEIRYDNTVFDNLPIKPSRIFVGSTMELFGEWIERDWWHMIMTKVLARPQHTFIFLTKLPHKLPKKFPDNCWVGVSTTGNDLNAWLELIFKDIQAKVKFVSIEPLKEYVPMDFRWVDWIIVGQQTPIRESTTPSLGDISDITSDAYRYRKPIFLKNNLSNLINPLRQEFPK